jgi:hypothetical protein
MSRKIKIKIGPCKTCGEYTSEETFDVEYCIRCDILRGQCWYPDGMVVVEKEEEV